MTRGTTSVIAATSVAAAALIGAAPSTGATAADDDAGVRSTDREVDVRLRTAARRLPVSPERRAGYDRELFRLWVDADGDCQDTRDEVLATESRVRVRGCDIARGRWLSYYDGVTWTDSGDVDIDHLVPLAEAWDSGARHWSTGTRERYANDLGDSRTLVAVTDNVNQSKGDQDIAEWLPELSHCRYVREWVSVKIRWSLTADRAEKRTARRLADQCRNVVLHVRKAHIG